MLIIFGIMLVRSGSLISVHAFASNIVAGQYIISAFLGIVLFVMILYWKNVDRIVLYAIANPNLVIASEAKQSINVKMDCRGPMGLAMTNLNSISTHSILSYGTIFIYLAAISIFIGIVYPLIYSIIMGENISLDNSYFHLIFIPLCIVIVIFTAIAACIKNGFLKKYNHAMIMSHIGIVILAIGITLNTFLKKDIEFIGKKDDLKTYSNIEVKVQNIKYAAGPNYYRQIVEFWINDNDDIVILKPENRFYKIENMLSAESDIYSFLSKDIYAVLGNVDEKSNIYANIYIRPFMSLIWLGMFMIASGIVISVIKKTTHQT
jgi:cytochrome c-type biogenesis protein CcmF